MPLKCSPGLALLRYTPSYLDFWRKNRQLQLRECGIQNLSIRLNLLIMRLQGRLWLTMYLLKCERWNVKYELWNLNGETWAVNCELWNVKYEMWIVNCKMRSVKVELWIVKCEIWNMNCEMWNVNCESWTVNGMWGLFMTQAVIKQLWISQYFTHIDHDSVQ
jgi:hypothetical protein